MDDSELDDLAERNELRQLQQQIASALTQSEFLTKSKSELKNSLQLDDDEILRNRQILHAKRISQIASMLPQTVEAMGVSYRGLVVEYAVSNHINGVGAIQRDAIAFANWLGSHKEVELWTRQLAVWESIPCLWYTSRFSVRFFRFDYDFRRFTDHPKACINCWCVFRIGSYSNRIRFL